MLLCLLMRLRERPLGGGPQGQTPVLLGLNKLYMGAGWPQVNRAISSLSCLVSPVKND